MQMHKKTWPTPIPIKRGWPCWSRHLAGLHQLRSGESKKGAHFNISNRCIGLSGASLWSCGNSPEVNT